MLILIMQDMQIFVFLPHPMVKTNYWITTKEMLVPQQQLT